MSVDPGTNNNTLVKAATVNGGAVGIMWILEIIDQLTRNSLDRLGGIHPRSFDSVVQIFTAPWLHFGWAHLASNSIPFLVLGVIIFFSGIRRWVLTFLITAVVSGIFVWLFSPPGSLTLGASGVVFGFLTYLLVRGLFTKKWSQIAVALLVFMLYGGVLWGVLPTQAGVSWQGHLGGAVGGVLAAWIMHAKRDRGERSKAQYSV